MINQTFIQQHEKKITRIKQINPTTAYLRFFAGTPLVFFPLAFLSSSSFRFAALGWVVTKPVDLKKLSIRPCCETWRVFFKRSIAFRIRSSLKIDVNLLVKLNCLLESVLLDHNLYNFIFVWLGPNKLNF